MTRPFRFGVLLEKPPAGRWAQLVQRIEALGYASVCVPDHFGTQWDPTTLLAAAAAVTQSLKVCSLVYDVDYRHPVVFAKAAATLHLVSGGRHEFGLGAGWMQSDYEQAGMDYAPAGVRIDRLDEALEIIARMWSQDSTTYAGRHYQVRDIARAAPLPAGERPPIVIGGGGRRLLTLAGGRADIVGINPTHRAGRITAQTPHDLAPERLREKLDWVREGAEHAGRSFAALELSALPFVVQVTDEPGPLRERLARDLGMTLEQVAACHAFLIGSGSELCDQLQKRREETGISYVVVSPADEARLEAFAERVIEPLAGR